MDQPSYTTKPLMDSRDISLNFANPTNNEVANSGSAGNLENKNSASKIGIGGKKSANNSNEMLGSSGNLESGANYGSVIKVSEEDKMGTLEIKFMEKNTSANFSSSTLCIDLVKIISQNHGIGLEFAHHFGLKILRNQNDLNPDTYIWLCDSTPLYNQKCDSFTVLLMEIKYWFYDIKKITDQVFLEIFYDQVQSLVLSHRYPAKDEVLIFLAGMQLRIDNRKSGIDSTILNERTLTNYIPRYALSHRKTNDWIHEISFFFKRGEQKNITSLHQEYIEYARYNIPHLTSIFFVGHYQSKEMVKGINVLIGLNPEGFAIYHTRSKSQTLKTFLALNEVERIEVKAPIAGMKDERSQTAVSNLSVALSEELQLKSDKNLHAKQEPKNSYLENSLVKGPEKFVIKIFQKSDQAKEYRFNIFSFLNYDPGIVSSFRYYATRYQMYLNELDENPDRENYVSVEICDGSMSKKLKIRNFDTGEAVLNDFGEKIGMKSTSFFQLAVDEGDCFRWITLSRPVLEQNVHEYHKIVLRVRFFVSSALDITDPFVRYLVYIQAKEAVVDGSVITTFQQAIELAALSVIITVGGSIHEPKKTLSDMVDEVIAKVHIEGPEKKSIISKLQKQVDSTLERAPESAVLKYLRIAQELPNYGITFFSGLIPKTGDDCLFGVGNIGCCLYKTEDMELLGTYRFGFELREWKNVGESIRLSVKASRNAEEKTISITSLQCVEALNLLTFYDNIRSQSKKLREANDFIQ